MSCPAIAPSVPVSAAPQAAPASAPRPAPVRNSGQRHLRLVTAADLPAAPQVARPESPARAVVKILLCAVLGLVGGIYCADTLGWGDQETRPYLVQPGDTLSSVASEISSTPAQWQQTIADIRSLNDLGADTLIAGQTIDVPLR